MWITYAPTPQLLNTGKHRHLRPVPHSACSSLVLSLAMCIFSIAPTTSLCQGSTSLCLFKIHLAKGAQHPRCVIPIPALPLLTFSILIISRYLLVVPI